MLLNSKKRTNNILFKGEFKNIDRKIVVFIVTLMINLLIYNNEPILFVTPFLILGYLLGFSYLVIVIMAAFIAALFYSPLIFFNVCLFVSMFFILVTSLRFLKMKVELKLLISSYISDLLARYIYQIGILDELTLLPLIFSLVSLTITFIVLFISKELMNEGKKQYSYKVVLSLLSIVSLSLLGMDYYINELSILFVLLGIYFLFGSRILDVSIYFSLLFITYFFLLFFNKFDNNNLFIIFIPCLFINITNKKYLRLLIYLLASLVILLFLKVKLDVYVVLSYLLISLFYLLIPSLLVEHLKELIINPLNNIELYKKKYQSLEKDIEKELNTFSNLFSLIAKEYDQDNQKRLERKQEDVIYRSLCVNCHKNKICYGKDDRLKRLMLKSIESEISEDEVVYVNKECLKPAKYMELSNLFKKDYYKEYKYNLEYQGLKSALKSQMLGLSNVINQYVKKLQYDQDIGLKYENELIKDLLDKYQYDVIYVNYYKDYKKDININLCVKINDHQEIYKIKELISNEYNLNLEIKEVSEYSLEGFLKIELKTIYENKITYGVHQINLKEEGNGDSYLIYEDDNYVIFSLSDGMGVGKDAKEESSFTLKVLKGILDTGMDLKNGISLINSLLKVKNRYETYATLDLVSINKKNLKAHFFKNGSMHSYIYSSLENRLIEINSSSLPVGIVDYVYSSSSLYKLRNNDYIIMFSDGLKEDIDGMEGFFRQINEYNPSIIAREIAMRFKNNKESDDVSVIVIKITK